MTRRLIRPAVATAHSSCLALSDCSMLDGRNGDRPRVASQRAVHPQHHTCAVLNRPLCIGDRVHVGDREELVLHPVQPLPQVATRHHEPVSEHLRARQQLR